MNEHIFASLLDKFRFELGRQFNENAKKELTNRNIFFYNFAYSRTL